MGTAVINITYYRAVQTNGTQTFVREENCEFIECKLFHVFDTLCLPLWNRVPEKKFWPSVQMANDPVMI